MRLLVQCSTKIIEEDLNMSHYCSAYVDSHTQCCSKNHKHLETCNDLALKSIKVPLQEKRQPLKGR